MIRRSFMTLFAVLFLSSLGFSQTGKVSGKVVDRETGDALPGANVVIVGTTFGAATDVTGEFVILSVPTGVYTLRSSFIGYRDITIEYVRVNSGLTTSLEFALPSEALEVSEISIVAERPLVNKNSTNAVRIQGYDDMKNLPIRGVTAAVALQPGIVQYNGELYIRGGRENDVGYFLEGANIRDRDGGSQVALGGANPVGVIPEALEEFQIQAGGYTAEFGGANAGIIRQTLKTGGSDYNFTFQFETDDFTNAGETFFDTFSYGYRDLTATLGGPVPGTNDRLRFFVAGERRLTTDYIQRFNRGFNFQHVDETEFNALSQDEQLASIAQGRFPIILEVSRDADLEASLQKQGLVYLDGNTPNADREEWVGNGTLVFDANPLIFRLGGSFNWRRQDEVIGNIPSMIFNNRIEQEEFSSALINLKATHLLGAKSFYELNLSYFDRREHQYDPIMRDNFWALWDSTANAARGVQFFNIDQPWRGGTQVMEVYGFDFEAPGSPIQSNTVKTKRNYFGGSFNFTTQLPQHELKIGVSYERWTVRNFSITAQTALNFLRGARQNPDILRQALAGDRSDPQVLAAQRNLGALARGVSFNYGYDVFGNEIDVDGVDGPRHPKYFSAYIQDKFEASDLVINAGVRLDVIDNDDFTFSDTSNPPWDQANFGLIQDQLRKVDAQVEVSPRLGIAFPVTDRTVFHLQYGRFVQAPRLTDIYNGSKWFDDIFTAGNTFQSNLVGLGLKPEITTQYEIGFNQQFSDNAAFDVTTFYKNIKDQIQVTRITTIAATAAGDYNVLANLDFATTAGVELSLTLRRTSRVAAQVNYTFSRALGTGSVANSAISGIEQQSEVPTAISPLDFHRAQTGSFNLDYRYGRGDGGAILEQLGANLLFTFQSGHPYTFARGDFGQQDESLGGQITDPRSRFPLENVNASTTPWNFQIDLRVDKTIDFGKFNTNFYVYVQNITNRENVINVFQRTGNAFDDAFLSDDQLSNSVLTRRNEVNPGFGAAAYEALYRAINLGGNAINFRSDLTGPQNFNGLEVLGVPRQIRVGARFEF
ncbi:MAG: carboxypeptidase-like regulatory domain-containing protein [bacterium]